MEDFNYMDFGLVDHKKSEKNVFNELIEKYHKYGTLYIGVDFDNTLLPYGMDDVPQDILDYGIMIGVLKQAKACGLKLCLWTLPMSEENLQWKIEWCKEKGIEMDYINESPLLSEYSKKFGKPHFNLLLDDTAGLGSAFNILYNLINYLTFVEHVTDKQQTK